MNDKVTALKYFIKGLSLTKPAQGFGPVLVKKTVAVLMQLNQYKNAIHHLHYYQNIYKDFKDLLFLEALCHIHCGCFTKAKKCLYKYKSIPNPKNWFYPCEEYIKSEDIEAYIEEVERNTVSHKNFSLSVCIIAKNEICCIKECIQSINEIADEVIVIDTGSTDKTLFLAEQLGSDTYRYEWNNNFSNARNFAIKKAKSDWILFIDADEILTYENRISLSNLLENPDCDAYYLLIHTFLSRQQSYKFCNITSSCRLFKNSGFYYTGKILEKVDNSIIQSDKKIGCSDVYLIHKHFNLPVNRINEKREIKMSIIKNLKPENSLFGDYALGIEYCYQNKYAKAQLLFKKCIEENYICNASLYYYYVLSLVNSHKYELALQAAEKSILKFPDYIDIYYLKAISLIKKEDESSAIPILKECINMKETYKKDYIVFCGTGNCKSMQTLAGIYIKNKKYDAALNLLVDSCKYLGGLENGVANIAQIFIFKNDTKNLQNFLKKHNLWNNKTITIICSIYANNNLFKESLDFLKIKYSNDKMSSENLDGIMKCYDSLISCMCRKII